MKIQQEKQEFEQEMHSKLITLQAKLDQEKMEKQFSNRDQSDRYQFNMIKFRDVVSALIC